jgi:hypothetical protein
VLLPEQIRWIDKQLKRLEGLNAPPEQKEAARKELERLKSQDVDEAYFKSQLMDRKSQVFFAWVDEQVERLENLNLPPGHKKARREHLESLKTDNPTPYPFLYPVRLRKHRGLRIMAGNVRIPPSPPELTMKQRVARGEKYIPPVLTPEQEREKRAEVRWHAQKGLWSCKRALERANSIERREHTLWVIKIYEEMLERNKEHEGT